MLCRYSLIGNYPMPIVINSDKQHLFLKKIGNVLNSPEQRLILGATALATQPFIDFHNHAADNETRAVSTARTIGKIIAGTLTGVSIRYGAIKGFKHFAQYNLKLEKGIVKEVTQKTKNDIFFPLLAKIKPNQTVEEFERGYSKYINAMGTFIATTAMVFTNFLIDAPLTKFITNELNPKFKKKLEKQDGGKKYA